MNLLMARQVHAVGSNGACKQFVTLRVVAPHDPLNSELMRAMLAGTPGVETIEVNAEHERVWVFGDGTVDTEDLLGTLAWWGYGARVLNDQLNLTE